MEMFREWRQKDRFYLPERTYLDENQRVSDAIDFFVDFYEDFDRSRAMGKLERLSIDPSARIKTLQKAPEKKVQLILVMSRRGEALLPG